MGSAAASLIQTVRADFVIDLPVSVAVDIQTYWLSMRLASPGSLNAPMSADATTFTYLPAAGGLGSVTLAEGNSVLIDDEVMSVTGVSSGNITVKRNTAPLSEATQAHDSGAAVYLLAYPDPWGLIADLALRPWAQQVVMGLGARSTTFGAKGSGSLTLQMMGA